MSGLETCPRGGQNSGSDQAVCALDPYAVQSLIMVFLEPASRDLGHRMGDGYGPCCEGQGAVWT